MTFLQILEKYSQVILSAISIILIFVTMLIKRRPKTFDDFIGVVSEACLQVPLLTAAVEQPGHGEEKKQTVIQSVVHSVNTKLKRQMTSSEEAYVRDKAALQIEMSLSSPKRSNGGIL